MIRLLLCGLLCFCTFSAGNEFYRQKASEAEKVYELSDVVSRIVAMLEFDSRKVYEICSEAFKGCERLDCAEFSKITDGDFPSRWKAACEGLFADKEAKKYFLSVGEVLGSFGCESQTERLRSIRESLIERAKKLSESAESKKKLYETLGILSGLAVSIIIV